MSSLEWPDILVIVAYFVLTMFVGFWATCRAKTDTAQGYFLAGRTMTWIPIGASTWATNIGAPMFIGLAGSAASGGIAVVMYEWHAMFMLIALGWLFLPVYIACGCLTMPEYLKLRYGGQRIRVLMAFISMFIQIVSNISGQMYAGAIFFQEVFEWSLYPSILFILAITACFSALGGLTAVIWTDTMQTVILILGSSLLSFIALNEVGGFNAMREQYMLSASNETYLSQSLWGNLSCGEVPDRAFHIFRPADDGSHPWPGMIFGLTILATHAWCTDQTPVQRSLSAKNMSHGKAGLLLAAYLKILPFLFFIIPGMISRVLYADEVACSDPDFCDEICNNPSGCSNVAYPLLVIRILPTGARGIMLAALLAALISSLTSIFNSVCTVFTMEVWKRGRPRAQEGELMVVSRFCTLGLVIISVAWLPVLTAVQGSNFWDYIQSLASYTTPPPVAIFIIGILWKGATEKAAFSALVIGECIGFIRMGLEWSRAGPDCGSGDEDNQFKIVTEIQYLHFAAILFTICVIIILVVSQFTRPREPNKLHRVTVWTRDDEELPELSESDSEDIPEQEQPAHHTKRRSKWKKRFLKTVCGVKSGPQQNMSKEEKRQKLLEQTDIYEEPWWRRFMNVQAIVCCGCAVVLHAFWA